MSASLLQMAAAFLPVMLDEAGWELSPEGSGSFRPQHVSRIHSGRPSRRNVAGKQRHRHHHQ